MMTPECQDWCAARTPHDGPCYVIEAGGVHNGPPAVPPTLTMPTAEQRTAMHRASLKVQAQASGMVKIIDTAHAQGLAVPPKVAEALDTLAALAAAWRANSAGHPAPPSIKAKLGVR